MKTIYWVMGFFLLTTGMAFAEKTASDYFALGAQLYSAKDYQGAYYAYEAGVILDPTSAAGYQGVGDSLYYWGRQSEALLAYQKSLALNPNNPKLAAFVKDFKPTDTIAQETNDGRVVTTEEDLPIDANPNTSNSQASTVLGRTEIKLALNKGSWVRAYGGFDFSFLNDFTSGIIALGTINSAASTVVNTGSNGIVAGAEFGVQLDSGNAFSISVENIWTQTESFSNGITNINDPNALFEPSFQPDLMSISLNYYAFIPGSKGSRTYLEFGAGLYQAVVGYTGWDPSTIISGEGLSPNETGTFSASSFGGSFGLGETLAVGDSFGIDLAARFRIVTFNELTAPEISYGGTTSTDGPYAVAINTTNGATAVLPINNNIGNGYRYVVLDYSGFDGTLSFNFYF